MQSERSEKRNKRHEMQSERSEKRNDGACCIAVKTLGMRGVI